MDRTAAARSSVPSQKSVARFGEASAALARRAGKPPRSYTAAWAVLFLGLLALAVVQVPAAESEAGARYFVSATVGGGVAAPRVFLRWSEMERPPAYSRFLLKRREASDASFMDLALVAALTDAAEIEETVFEAPGNEVIQPDITDLLGLEYASELLLLRDDPDSVRAMQYQLLLNTNYGVAIAHGLAYLDTEVVAGTRYAYEVWGLDESDIPVERLGKLWAAAGVDTVLPAPQLLTVVSVAEDVDGDGRFDKGSFGDGQVYLRWDPKPGLEAEDRETLSSGFGFDVYREVKGAAPCLPTPGGDAVQVNEVPVIPVPAVDEEKIPDFFFVDDNTNPDIPVLVRGTSYCYWLVARDLLRQQGEPSAPVEACVPDLGRPRQVRDVTTQVIFGVGIEVSWTLNEDDPVTLEGGTRYIDDTASYNVYRFTDFSELLHPPDPVHLVPECTGVPASASSCNDAAADLVVGRIYWYAVTAVDTAVCGNPANESSYSAPARAVIYDLDAPDIVIAEPFCDTAQDPLCIRDCGQTGGPADEWCNAGGASGVWPLPGDEWGYRVPRAGMPVDTMSVRLYRGASCASVGGDFRPVEEAFLTDPADSEWRAYETFRARISQKIEYRLRALDRDSNLGGVAEPLGAAAQPMPAYVLGNAPPRPTIVKTNFNPGAGTIQVRWHAPGAAALVGFVMRVGPAGAPAEGTFYYLPDDSTYPPEGNFLFSEASEDPPRLPRDVDLDGVVSPRKIVIRDQTRCLGELGADLGGLRAADGYLEYTVAAVLAFDSAVELYAIDVAGQLSPPAAWAHFSPDVDPLSLDWPERRLPPVAPLVGQYVTDHVDLCWDQAPLGRCSVTRAICPAVPCEDFEVCDPLLDPAPLIAVFRTRVEGRCSLSDDLCDQDADCPGAETCELRPDSYQQRSPLVRIRDYMAGGGGFGVIQCACTDGMVDPICWQDYGVVEEAFYKYTVLRFWGPPDSTAADRSDMGHRSEGEIQTVFGPHTVETTVP